MSLCIAAPTLAMTLAVQSFTLSWTHSVERIEWRERWRIEGTQLVLDEARVRGSGAGMEPPEGSALRHGWWVYHRALSVPALNLAVSGATVDGWRLCTNDTVCVDLETELSTHGIRPSAIQIRPLRDTDPACRPRDL